MDLRHVTSRSELDAVYSLRYAAYRRCGAIAESVSNRFSDEFDSEPSSCIYAVFDGASVIGAVRTLTKPAGSKGVLTAARVFARELETELQWGSRVIEANRLVTACDDGTAKGSYIIKLLLRATMMSAFINGVRHYVAAARAEHVPFYRSRLLMRPISPPARYPGLSVDMVLLAGDFAANYPVIASRHPIFRFTLDDALRLHFHKDEQDFARFPHRHVEPA